MHERTGTLFFNLIWKILLTGDILSNFFFYQSDNNGCAKFLIILRAEIVLKILFLGSCYTSEKELKSGETLGLRPFINVYIFTCSPTITRVGMSSFQQKHVPGVYYCH